jgi:high-affinity iron transporter
MWGFDRRKDRGPPWNGSMLGALIIVFREVIEAGLIVGIVMAATRGVAGRGRWVCIGIGAGIAGAALVALFAGAISQAFEGAGQELFNASVLGVAVVMLMWHNAWMARHGREIAAEMRNIGTAVSQGARPLTALAVVVGLAVLREGSEVVLFLYGIFASGTSGLSLLTGGLLGVAAGAAFTGLTYFGLLAIPSRYIFSVTSWLIALLAAGMAAQSVQFLDNAGLVVAFDRTVWDTSWLLSESSIFGRLLHTLIGYTERPTEMQLLVYIATLLVMYLLMRFARYRPQQRVAV